MTSFEYTLGSGTSEIRLGWESNVQVTDDRPFPPVGDELDLSVTWIGPILGQTLLVGVYVWLYDVNGTAFTSTSLPGPLPAMDVFEDRGVSFRWFNRAHSRSGLVRCILDTGATPAPATSWGRVKGLYRGR